MDRTCGATEVAVFVVALLSSAGSSISSKVLMNIKSVGLSGDEETFSYPLFQPFALFLGMMAGLVVHALVVWFAIPFPGYNHVSSHRTSDGTKLDSMADRKPSMRKNASGTFDFIDEDAVGFTQATWSGISRSTSGMDMRSPSGMTQSAATDLDYNYNSCGDYRPDEASVHSPYMQQPQPQPQQIRKRKLSTPLWMYFYLLLPTSFDVVATILCMYGLRNLNVSVFQIFRGMLHACI